MSLKFDLIDFIKCCHHGQKRKYTNKPYYTHLLSVHKIATKYSKYYLPEIALSHDLFEDTICDEGLLFDALNRAGYSSGFSDVVINSVHELTDQFTEDKFPNYKRWERKELEAKRLGEISPLSQTVKYADIIDNVSTIVQLDPDFAKIYINEKILYLNQMVDGHQYLRNEALTTISSASQRLNGNIM